MTDKLLNERELNFQLYEMLDTEALLERPRYADHDRAVFDATLETARGIAAEYLAPHNQKGDANEPTFDGEKVTLIPETKAAWNALARQSRARRQQGCPDGGLPELLRATTDPRAAISFFRSAPSRPLGMAFKQGGRIFWNFVTVGIT